MLETPDKLELLQLVDILVDGPLTSLKEPYAPVSRII